MTEEQMLRIGSRNMILFVFGKVLAAMGSSIYAFSVSLYILKVTGSAMNFSISLICSSVPRILLGPVAGVVSDRFNRKRIIVIADFLSAFVVLSACITFSLGYTEVWVMYVTSVLLSIVSTFYQTAISSAIPNMINSDRLQKVSSMNQAIYSFSGMFGPVIGGIMFAYFHEATFMFINACTFFLSAVTAVFIRYDLYATKEERVTTSVMTSFKEGFAYVKEHRFLTTLIQMALILNFLFAALNVYLPYTSVTTLALGSKRFGMIEASLALGTFLFAIILSSRPEIKNKNRAVYAGSGGIGLMFFLIGLAASPLFHSISKNMAFLYIGLICFTLGALIMIINIPIIVTLQKETPDEYRGRVMAFLETGASAITPLGYILFGALVDYVSPFYILVVISVFTIGATLFLKRTNALQLNAKEHTATPNI